MVAEQNFRQEITLEWIDSVRRTHVPMCVLLASFAGYCAGHSIKGCHRQSEFSEEIAVKALIAKYAKENSWSSVEICDAYEIARCKIRQIAKHLELIGQH